MLTRSALLAVLILALARPTAAQLPTDYFISVLHASTQELQAAAQLSSAQQAYSTITRIVNEILKAMQRMSLPYYQNQLRFISDQQVALLARMRALRNSVAIGASAVFRTIGAVSASLAAQTGNIGSLVINFSNTFQPRILQAQTNVNALQSVLPDVVAASSALSDQIATLQTSSADMVTQVADAAQAFQTLVANVLSNHWSTVVEVAQSALGATATPYCKIFTVPFDITYTNPPKVAVFPFALTLSNQNRPLDVARLAVSTSSVDVWLCDRTRATFTFIPTKLYVEVQAA